MSTRCRVDSVEVNVINVIRFIVPIPATMYQNGSRLRALKRSIHKVFKELYPVIMSHTGELEITENNFDLLILNDNRILSLVDDKQSPRDGTQAYPISQINDGDILYLLPPEHWRQVATEKPWILLNLSEEAFRRLCTALQGMVAAAPISVVASCLFRADGDHGVAGYYMSQLQDPGMNPRSVFWYLGGQRDEPEPSLSVSSDDDPNVQPSHLRQSLGFTSATSAQGNELLVPPFSGTIPNLMYTGYNSRSNPTAGATRPQIRGHVMIAKRVEF